MRPTTKRLARLFGHDVTSRDNDSAYVCRNMIAVASGKGGVGKTWVSVTLAHLIARSGRRVLLFDGDIGLANVDVQLGISPERDLADLFTKRMPLSEIVMPYDQGGFDVIAGRSGHAGMGDLSPEQLGVLKSELLGMARNYDFVVLDLGAGVERYVRMLSALAAKCLLVVTDEPTSLTDAYAFIKLCHTDRLGVPPPQIQVLVNQAVNYKEGERTYGAIAKACQTFLGLTLPLGGIVRRDPQVRESIRAQMSIMERAPHATAASDMAALSVKLMMRE